MQQAIRVEQQPQPRYREAHKPGQAVRYGRRAIAATLSAAALTMGGAFGSDVIRPESSQETIISQGIRTGLGESVTVRCVSGSGMRLRQLINPRNALRPLDGMAIPHVPFIWLTRDRCNNIAAFVQHPAQQASDFRDEQISALHDAAHEVRHTQGEPNEAKAQCAGVQQVGHLAVALGMPAALIPDIAQADADLQNRMMNPNLPGPRHYPAHYAFPADCASGQAGDLRVLPPADFPYLKPDEVPPGSSAHASSNR